MEMLGTCFFSGLERATKKTSETPGSCTLGDGHADEKNRQSLWLDYAIVVGCLMSSSSLSNIALNYINFPTKASFLI